MMNEPKGADVTNERGRRAYSWDGTNLFVVNDKNGECKELLTPLVLFHHLLTAKRASKANNRGTNRSIIFMSEDSDTL